MCAFPLFGDETEVSEKAHPLLDFLAKAVAVDGAGLHDWGDLLEEESNKNVEGRKRENTVFVGAASEFGTTNSEEDDADGGQNGGGEALVHGLRRVVLSRRR